MPTHLILTLLSIIKAPTRLGFYAQIVALQSPSTLLIEWLPIDTSLWPALFRAFFDQSHRPYKQAPSARQTQQNISKMPRS